MKRLLRVVRAWLEDNWQVSLVVVGGIAAVSILLLFKLGSLQHGLSESEFQLQQLISQHLITPKLLLRNPIYLPYYLALYVVQLGPFHGPSAVRFVGALFGLLGAVGFFYILRRWYSLRMATFGTALFATSSWFLHAARFASPEASYLLLPLLIAGVVHIQTKVRTRPVLFLVVLLGLLCFYIPGLIWFLIPAVALEWHVITRSLKLQPWWFLAVLALTGILLFVPAIVMLVSPFPPITTSQNFLALVGLPAHFPSPAVIVKNAGHLLSNIFAYNNQGPLYVPGHLPLLDVATSTLALIGTYQFARHFKLDRTKLLAILGIIGALLITTNGPVSTVLLLPFVYFVAVEGLRILLEMWLKVFPHNPFARSFAVGIVVVLVAAISVYHLNRYFLAWGHAPETRAAFNKLP